MIYDKREFPDSWFPESFRTCLCFCLCLLDYTVELLRRKGKRRVSRIVLKILFTRDLSQPSCFWKETPAIDLLSLPRLVGRMSTLLAVVFVLTSSVALLPVPVSVPVSVLGFSCASASETSIAGVALSFCFVSVVSSVSVGACSGGDSVVSVASVGWSLCSWSVVVGGSSLNSKS